MLTNSSQNMLTNMLTNSSQNMLTNMLIK